jgi:hypothetical protein
VKSTGAPDSMSDMLAIDRILALIRGSTGAETVGQARSRTEKIRELQKEAAAAFGTARGWNLSTTTFSAAVLARRGVSGRPSSGVDPTMLDHAYYYRAQDRRAVGIVAHLYDLDADAVCTWAHGHGLRASSPREPSWWYPSWTKLVLYEPCDSAMRHRLHEIRDALRVKEPADDCPITPLGQRGGRYFFLKPSGEIRELTPRAMTRRGLLALFDGDQQWLLAHFGEIDKQGQKTGTFALVPAACDLIRRCAAAGLVDPTALVAALPGGSCRNL